MSSYTLLKRRGSACCSGVTVTLALRVADMSGREGVLPMGEGSRPGPKFGRVADCMTTAAAVSSISSSVWSCWGFREANLVVKGLL